MASFTRTNAETETAQSIGLPLTGWKNADGSTMPATTPAAGQFAHISGGWGVGGHKLQSEAASGNTKTPTTKQTFVMPQNYVAGTSFELKITHRTSAVANTTASIDASVFKSDGNGGVTGSDLVTTGAITYNNTAWTTSTYAVTTTGLSPGDEIDVYVRGTVDDSGGATGAKAEIGKTYLSLSTKM